ncbi:hypothetical protein GCM10023187_14680 [Nibrella viscosa]|uniref:Uncharacterized protein n=1 Tax=Nibrella viscosa TaxID=1084524 RepID=A0ABP8K5J9_9BACT
MVPLISDKTLTIDSPLTREKALRRLRANLIRPGSFVAGANQEPEYFQGTVWDYEFQLSRVTWYPAWFLPAITGRLYTHQDRLTVRVTIALSPAACVCTTLGLVLMSVFALSPVARFISSGHLDPASLLPLVPAALVYLLVTIGFAIEADLATRYLKRLLDAEAPVTTLSTLAYSG